MKISIITVSYNRAGSIDSTLNSVLSQNFKDIEYIIIDGASSDGTVDKIKQKEELFDGKMHWISEPDKGIYDAMNKGISMSHGDIVGILNSDDIYKSDRILDTVADCFDKKNCDAVYGDIEFVSSTDPQQVIRHWKSSPYTPGGFLQGWHLPHPSLFVKKEVYDQFGVFDTNFEVSSDFELMLRFIEKEKIKTEYIPETFVSMAYGGESTGSLKKIITGNLNVLRAFKKHNIPVNSFGYMFTRVMSKLNQFNV